MERSLPKLTIFNSTETKVNYLSPVAKRSLTTRSSERINFNKCGFSSPKCVRATHNMLSSNNQAILRKNSPLETSKSILLNNRRIGEKLLFDSFPGPAHL